MEEWQSGISKSAAAAFDKFTDRIANFLIFIPELERIATEQGPQAARDWAPSAGAVKAVGDDLGSVAARIRGQVDQSFERLSA
jgi:hypothetical protein